jgi:predicted  nucleic acid-binding Zn-ribbon protein
MRRVILALAFATLLSSPARSVEPEATVEELRRLNQSVERLAVLMERLVDERRVEALQRQLAIENERLAPLEERLAVERDAIAELTSEQADLARERQRLERQKDEYAPALVQGYIRPKIDEIDARLSRIEVDLAERERRARDLEAEAAILRERKADLSAEIDASLGLAP